MKKILVSVIVGLMFLAPVLVLAAATTTTDWVLGQPVKVVKVAWTSDAAGEVWTSLGEAVNGKVFAVKTIPGATTLAPTDNYDVYIKDYASSYNFLSTTLENRDTANTEMIAPSNVPMYGTIGFSVTAAGDTNAGEVWLYVEVPK